MRLLILYYGGPLCFTFIIIGLHLNDICFFFENNRVFLYNIEIFSYICTR